MHILGDSFNCLQCGKHVETIYLDQWAYKIRLPRKKDSRTYGPRYFCSYKCLRQYENEHRRSKEDDTDEFYYEYGDGQGS